jgi:hypothetical protein
MVLKRAFAPENVPLVTLMLRGADNQIQAVLSQRDVWRTR